MSFADNLAYKIANIIITGTAGRMTDIELLEKEIAKWKTSPQRKMQIQGHLYYENEHDIKYRKRTAIGKDGEIENIDNLPNNHLIDNQYAKLVNQKANYLLGQPFVVEGDNDIYVSLLKDIFDKRFMKTLKNAGKAAMNGGIAWLYPYYNSEGKFCFRLFPAYEILPFWKDNEHTVLECAVRLYLVRGYEGTTSRIIEKVEVFDENGIHCFQLDGGRLIPDVTLDDYECSYVLANGKPFNWLKIPLIPIKYNEQELPLLGKVKSLQDALNVMLSDFENNMQEDSRNTILVIKNYDGENLGEFRRNLATFGAVKVRTVEGAEGAVETLKIEVNNENYKVILELLKKAIIENGMGYDAKDDRLSGNPNQMNIQSMYSDIDLDANDMETELQAAFDNILWFINAHLANTGKGDFENEDITVIFNRDILINETEAIANCAASLAILSEETVVSQHPWVDDVQKELDRLNKQREEEQKRIEEQYNPFGSKQGDKPPDSKEDDLIE